MVCEIRHKRIFVGAAVFFMIRMQDINSMALCRTRGSFIIISLSIAWTIH